MPDGVRKIADAVGRAADRGAVMRIAKVTEVVGAKVRLDITGTALVAVDADVAALAVGQRVYAMQQGPVAVVSGRLTGAPPPAAPVGALSLYAGSSTAVPTGYLLCQGQSLLRTEWPDLFAVIGTTYGAADATTFSLPNLTDRVPLGAGSAGRGRGAVGGAESVTLTTAQIPAHTHGSTGAHTHTVPSHNAIEDVAAGTTATAADQVISGTQTSDSAGAHTHASVGGGGAHENMQPWVALYYMIRAVP